MQLLMIRHAQSANNKIFAETGAVSGRVADPDITDLGRVQADALARRLADDAHYPRITHLYSSLMRRTIQTAAPIADALDLPILARADTHEFPGPYEGSHESRVPHRGSSRSVLAALSKRAQLPDSATEEGWYHAGIETEELLQQRALSVVADLRSHHAETDVVAVVSHGWFGSVLVGAAIGADAGSWFDHYNTATTMVAWEHWPGDAETAPRPQTAVQWSNRTDHLAAGQLSA